MHATPCFQRLRLIFLQLHRDFIHIHYVIHVTSLGPACHAGLALLAINLLAPAVPARIKRWANIRLWPVMGENRSLLEVAGEGAGLRLFCSGVGQSKKIGGMDGRQQDTRAHFDWASPHVRKPRRRSRHSAKRGRAQRDDERRFHERKFSIQPPAAMVDLACARGLVDASFSARDEFEMLDRIREVALAFREARLA